MPNNDDNFRLRRARPRVAIVGATGAVGRELLNILAERDFPVEELRLLASPRSAGKTLTFRDHDIGVEVLDAESFTGIDLALFSAGRGRHAIGRRSRCVRARSSSTIRRRFA